MENIELAYLAGFFDGEGCIHVNKMKLRTHTGYSLTLEITQRRDNNEILHYVRSKFGGNFHHKRATFTSNPYDRWSIHGNQAINMLVQLLPYLRLKKLQAEVAISYNNELSSSEKETIRNKLQEMKAYKGA